MQKICHDLSLGFNICFIFKIFVVTNPTGLPVYSLENPESEAIDWVSPGEVLEVIERVDNRALISTPINGWLALKKEEASNALNVDPNVHLQLKKTFSFFSSNHLEIIGTRFPPFFGYRYVFLD
jgi:hypothetical protein